MAQAIDNGEKQWRPVDPMRHHREKGWDYRGRAIYHFTLPVEGRYPLFGTLEGESAETAFVCLNAFGRRVCQMLGGLAQFYKGKGYALKVLAQMVMPDHVHLVIQVLEPLPQSIGAVVRGFKSGCTKVYKEQFYCNGENAAEVHGDLQTSTTEVHGEFLTGAAEVHGAPPVQFARIFADEAPDKILTIESSGIALALATGAALHIPVVFAKKHRTSNIFGEAYNTVVNSYTHGCDYTVIVERDYLSSGEKILLIDDFLANGKAIEGLLDIISQAGAEAVGAGIAIEKGFQEGGTELRSKGLRVESLAIVESMDENGITFRK